MSKSKVVIVKDIESQLRGDLIGVVHDGSLKVAITGPADDPESLLDAHVYAVAHDLFRISHKITTQATDEEIVMALTELRNIVHVTMHEIRCGANAAVN